MNETGYSALSGGMIADSLESMLAERRRLDGAIARAHRLLARLPTFEVGDRVTLKLGADVLHATVVDLAPDHPVEPSAWVRIAGFSAWLHSAPLRDLRRVCGVCDGCRRLNERPECVA